MRRRSFLYGLFALLLWPPVVRAERGGAGGDASAGPAGSTGSADAEQPGSGASASDSHGSPSASASGAELPGETRKALESSPYVYVSPLRSDGSESTCHGEVWYGWLDGAVWITTRRSTWKARAVREGLETARIWVGDYGRWKRALGIARNEAFREGPSFEARAEIVEDPEVLDRLLARYHEKYPDEMEHWDPRMREAHASDERVLIRYEPRATG